MSGLLPQRCRGGGSSLLSAAVLLPPVLLAPFCAPRPRDDNHREMAWMVPIPWWRVLVGGKLGGALRIDRVVVPWGSGEIHVGLSGTDEMTPMGATIPS